jgi:Diguanylate cyclase, GGDEF domain
VVRLRAEVQNSLLEYRANTDVLDGATQPPRVPSQSQQEFDPSPMRWGGDEFAVLLPGCDLEQARAVAEGLRSGIEALRKKPTAPP